jgi:hypothetical protein
VQQRVLGHENKDTLFTRRYLAEALAAQGKCAEAETMLREVLEDLQRVLGPEHEDTLWTSLSFITTCLWAGGQYAEAETMYVNPTTVVNSGCGCKFSLFAARHSLTLPPLE